MYRVYIFKEITDDIDLVRVFEFFNEETIQLPADIFSKFPS